MLGAVLLSVSPTSGAAAIGSYSGWSAVVVAGDWHAHDGSPSEIFDNARRDVSEALIRAGFAPANIAQFSVRPERYPATHPLESAAGEIAETLHDEAARARGGCLLYFTSHGGASGLVLGEHVLTPPELDGIVSDSCKERPTVIVISACYSGVFMNTLARPNRMIVTAARKDRSSFGCGGTSRYPYFDYCFLQSLGAAKDFPDAALRSRACVARMERQTRIFSPSEPQIFVGTQILAKLPSLR